MSATTTTTVAKTQFSSSVAIPLWLSESPEWLLAHGDQVVKLARSAARLGRRFMANMSNSAYRYPTIRAFQRLAREREDAALDLGWVEIAVLTGELTEEQAGRIVAYAVGCELDKEAPFPIGVFGPWFEHSQGRCWDRDRLLPVQKKHSYHYARVYSARFGLNDESGDWYVTLDRVVARGQETGSDGKVAADASCARIELNGRAVRLLTIEELA